MARLQFNESHFWEFCANLKIESKEKGLVPLIPNGCQKEFIHQLAMGLNDEDIHTFVVLKGRQLGVSTISLALDLYWSYKHKGLQGTMVTDTDTNRTIFRSMISSYMASLPKQYKVPLKHHNVTELTLANGSRLIYQVAGTRKKGGLGRGTASMFMHATECSSWADEEGLKSLMATLADNNPSRLYVYESTARGYNLFHDMWETAKRSITQKAIFIGWWLNEAYRAEQDSTVYEAYWDGTLSPSETTWVGNIQRLYGYVITPEQIAWWRCRLEEGMHGDETMMMQEYPPTEDDAFVLSGSQFFTSERLSVVYKKALEYEDNYQSFRFSMGDDFAETVLKPTTPLNAELKIWQMPKKGAYYVIGADPAYGSSDWADRFAVQVLRCYADGCEQVAEYCTDSVNTYQFAWVICYLAGAYGNTMVNLEINGPGQAVWNEMLNLRRQAASGVGNASGGIYDVLGNIRSYLYRRNDTLGSGGMAYHWKTTFDTKARMMHGFKDTFERENMRVVSTELLDEMKSIVSDSGSIEASGKGKDDRVIAMALANIAWMEYIRYQLIQEGLTVAVSMRRDEVAEQDKTQVGSMVHNYLQRIGLKHDVINP